MYLASSSAHRKRQRRGGDIRIYMYIQGDLDGIRLPICVYTKTPVLMVCSTRVCLRQRSVVCFEYILWRYTAVVYSMHIATRLSNRSAGRAPSSPEHHVYFAAALKTHRTPAADVVHSHPWSWYISERGMLVRSHGRPASPI